MAEIDLTPITRLEYDIDAILNDHAVAEPITRIELILADIVAGNTTTVEPVTRIETYLAIISGADYPVPEPVTRIETFLAIIAGEDYEEPEAVTRLEGLLAEWVEKGSAIWKTVTGTLIHITDALASPMQKCEVTLEPIQAGSGDPSPTNVRPITGWTGCEVNRTGVNVWDEQYQLGYWDIANGSYHSANNQLCSKNYIPVKPDTEYRLVGLPSAIYLLFYDSEKGYLSRQSKSSTFTTPANAYFMHINLGSGYGTTYNNDVSVNYPSTDTSYHAYSGTTLSVTFPDSAGTVYGGTVDLVSGVLTVDRAKITNAQLLNSTFVKAVDGVFVCLSILIPNNPNTNFVDPKIIATALPTKSQTNLVQSPNSAGVSHFWSERIGIGTGDTTIIIPSDFKTWLAENGSDIVYPLAEPIEIQLTPQEISTLKGVNNVWSNSNGDTTLIYKAEAS